MDGLELETRPSLDGGLRGATPPEGGLFSVHGNNRESTTADGEDRINLFVARLVVSSLPCRSSSPVVILQVFLLCLLHSSCACAPLPACFTLCHLLAESHPSQDQTK